jgi:hypothetical protein
LTCLRAIRKRSEPDTSTSRHYDYSVDLSWE